MGFKRLRQNAVHLIAAHKKRPIHPRVEGLRPQSSEESAQARAQRRVPEQIRPREQHPVEPIRVSPLVRLDELRATLAIAKLAKHGLEHRQAFVAVVMPRTVVADAAVIARVDREGGDIGVATATLRLQIEQLVIRSSKLHPPAGHAKPMQQPCDLSPGVKRAWARYANAPAAVLELEISERSHVGGTAKASKHVRHERTLN
eukprot:7389172-Prymnesium_polylepis.2